MTAVVVADSIEIKENMPGSRHAPGLVVVFDGGGSLDIPGPGVFVTAQHPDGTRLELVVDEMKEHGSSRSYFFAGRDRSEVPVGSQIMWDDDRKLWRRAIATAVASGRHR